MYMGICTSGSVVTSEIRLIVFKFISHKYSFTYYINYSYLSTPIGMLHVWYQIRKWFHKMEIYNARNKFSKYSRSPLRRGSK